MFKQNDFIIIYIYDFSISILKYRDAREILQTHKIERHVTLNIFSSKISLKTNENLFQSIVKILLFGIVTFYFS